jgi:hypothetical protein
MAYYLEFDGDSYVHAATLGNVLSESTFRIETQKARFLTSSGYWFSQAVATGSSRELGLFFGSGSASLYIGGLSAVILSSADVVSIFGSSTIQSELLSFEINLSTGAWQLESEGAVVKTGGFALGSSRSDGALFRLGARAASDSSGDASGAYILPNGSRIGSTKVFLSGNLVRSYNKQTLNGSNDTVYPDTVGGNDGTLVNFPTDNSQWVFYDDGSGSEVTSDVTFTVNAPTSSASASATLPQPSADVSYSVSVPTVSASVTASLPQPSSNVVFTVNAPSVAASASATIPGYNASVSFTVNAPGVSADASATLPSPSADVGYTVNAPNISADVAASLPRPIGDIAFTVDTPSVNATASATQTGWNADVNFTVNAPSVSISASATLPQPEAAVSFAVSPPQVAVVAIVGGIAIIVDDETNINQRVLSNNINAPILSSNING